MGGTPELRLPTRAVAVELARVGHAPTTFELFVADAPQRERSVADLVLDLLEGATMFLPSRDVGDGRVAMLGKGTILWARIDDTSLGDELYDHVHRVSVEVEGGAELTGAVYYSSPAHQPRLTDHLNLPVHFLRVWSVDALYLIHKRHIIRVLELA